MNMKPIPNHGVTMKLLKRRMPKCFSLRQDLIIRIETELPRGEQSRWVETELLNALDRQGKQVLERDSQ